MFGDVERELHYEASYAIQFPMMLKNKTEIDGIGEILFERSMKARRLNISVRLSKIVRVAVPLGMAFEDAEKFVLSKKTWIQKHLNRMMQQEDQACESTRDDIQKNFRDDAKAKLVERLRELAVIHGFTYNKVSVRNQRTLWGSCSGRNNISLNIRVALLPDDLRDYVILHELVHTRVKNHSSAFWSELGKYLKNPKVTDAKLNRPDSAYRNIPLR